MTPVKNEAWRLDGFLRCASLWADVIIVADQGSTDGTPEIARRYPKVRLIPNSTPTYDEGARQRLLLDAAREIPGPRVIIALDADETLTATALSSLEWQRARTAPAGTVLYFDWVNLLPGLTSCWIPPDPVPFGFVDDGTEHAGTAIHSTRVPAPPGAPSMRMDTVKVLHYQYVNWSRMKSKQRWYQCWEVLNNPSKRPIQIYRQYHHMDAIASEHTVPVKTAWLDGYAQRGVNARLIREDDGLGWDAEVFDWLLEHGPERFRKLDIWDMDWAVVGRRVGRAVPPELTADPRSAGERAVHRWLSRTQPRSGERRVRWLQRLLALIGW